MKRRDLIKRLGLQVRADEVADDAAEALGPRALFPAGEVVDGAAA